MAHGTRALDHRANRLLAVLDPEDFAFLKPHLESVILPGGAILYETGDPLYFTYFPHDSIVSLVSLMEDGHAVEMAMFGREALIGIAAVFVTREALGRYVVRLPGTASRIGTDVMHRTIATRPAIQQVFLHFTEAMFAQTLLNVACNAVHSVEARCCRWILSTHDRADQDALPLTHELLAEMLGVQRSTVSAVMRSLQTAGLIAQRRGGIIVTDRAGLQQAACECYVRIRHSFERLLPGTFRKD